MRTIGIARAVLSFVLFPLALALPVTAGEVVAHSSWTRREPVYRIPLQIHLEDSAREPAGFRPILDEINEIWLTQAGICFEIRIAAPGQPVQEGLDLWFRPELKEGEHMNGTFRNDHDIQVRDTPNLGPAERPARHPAARTAAHEIGHSLDLRHRQDSDDNLMRSRTYGWQLSEEEVRIAREAAARKALPAAGEVRCGQVPL